jgi:hypothetical protein
MPTGTQRYLLFQGRLNTTALGGSSLTSPLYGDKVSIITPKDTNVSVQYHFLYLRLLASTMATQSWSDAGPARLCQQVLCCRRIHALGCMFHC